LTSYLVANAIILPASGWFSLRFGRRKLSAFFASWVFTISSFTCGAATKPGHDFWFTRAIQGAGGGALAAVCPKQFFSKVFSSR